MTVSFREVTFSPLRQNFIQQDGKLRPVPAFGFRRSLGQTAVDGLCDQCFGHRPADTDTDDGVTTPTTTIPRIARLALAGGIR